MSSISRLFLMALLAVVLVASPVAAAVNYCFDQIAGGPRIGATLQDAQKSALQAWMKAVLDKHGEKYTSWRLAQHKTLDCKAGDAGKHICQACAMPCGIEQVPPEGRKLPRLDPSKSGQAKTAPWGCPRLDV